MARMPISNSSCPHISSGEKVFVLCEKPSVARDLGAVLGSSADAGGYLPYSGGVISWAFGHLLQLANPADYRPDWKPWTWEALPMVPPDYSFMSVLRDATDARPKKQLETLGRLYREADVIVNACDAGREGELIWWEILRHCGWGKGLAPGVLGQKKALRFWAQSNTSAGLSEAWASMAPLSDRVGLAEAAYSRSEGDWLLGLNVSRATTLCFPPPEIGGKKTFWSVGRVQTPVLALVVSRDAEINNFKPRPFFEVRLTLGAGDPFEATLLVPEGVEPFIPEGGNSKEPKGFLTKDAAQVAFARVLATRPQEWDIIDEEKTSVENPPLLYSLTDLQKWCNQVWGWEAARTLRAAQAAYEVDKTLSYPRTDACFLPVDSKDKMDEIYSLIRTKFLDGRMTLPTWSLPPSASSRANFVFDDSKLTDHYAIVPTGLIPGDTTSDAGMVWLAVVRRFLVAFGPGAKVATIKRRCTFSSDVAVAGGKRYTDRGWIDADDLLAPLVGQTPKAAPAALAANPGKAPVDEARLHEGKTTPPKAFTEATLLGMMENIHTKLDSDEEAFKEALAGKGLGTPATRASIIELLVDRVYMQRIKKGGAPSLRATEFGTMLIESLRGADLAFLTQPDLTAEWESHLLKMERSTAAKSRVPFLDLLMVEVNRALEVLKSRAVTATSVGARPRVDIDTVCPLSGKPVGDFGTYWVFDGFGRVPKAIASREFTVSEVSAVLSGGSPVFEGFLSKKGSKFVAALKPNFETKRFDFVFADRPVSVAGTCPVTGKPIEDHGGYWVFPDRPNDRFWKTVAQRPVTLSEYSQMVEDGKSKLLEGFVSSKGSKFSANLVYKDGKVSFDFPPRPGGGPSSPGMKGPGAKAKSTGSGSSPYPKKKPKKTY